MLDVTVDLSPEEQRRRAAERRARLYPPKPVNNVVAEASVVADLRARIANLESELAKKRREVTRLRGEIEEMRLGDNFDAAQMGAEYTKPRVTVREVMEYVAAYFNLSAEDLIGTSQTRKVATPRQICCWLAREYTVASLVMIGRVLGNRDHTTILHGCRRIEAALAGHDADTTAAVKRLSSIIEGERWS